MTIGLASIGPGSTTPRRTHLTLRAPSSRAWNHHREERELLAKWKETCASTVHHHNPHPADRHPQPHLCFQDDLFKKITIPNCILQ